MLLQLRDETAGNPLYAVQLVRHFWESERLHGRRRLRFGCAARGTRPAVPRSLLEVVWSRVARARRSDRRSAPFGVGPRRRLRRGRAGRADRDVRAGGGRRRWMRPPAPACSSTPAMPGGPLRFTHALVAHALYSDLPTSSRRRLHGRAAHVLLRATGHPRRTPWSTWPGTRLSPATWPPPSGGRWQPPITPQRTSRRAEAAALVRAGPRPRDGSAGPDAERAELMVRLGEAQHRAGDPARASTLLAARSACPNEPHAHDVLVPRGPGQRSGFHAAGTVDHEQLAALEAAIAVADRDDTTTFARLLACRAQELVYTAAARSCALASAQEAIELVEHSDDQTLLPRVISAIVCRALGSRRRHARAPAAADRPRRRGRRPRRPDLSLEFSTEPRRVLRRHRVGRRRGGRRQLDADAGDRLPSSASRGCVGSATVLRGVRGDDGRPGSTMPNSSPTGARARHRDRRAQRVLAVRRHSCSSTGPSPAVTTR